MVIILIKGKVIRKKKKAENMIMIDELSFSDQSLKQ